jgi:hypothetical protein
VKFAKEKNMKLNYKEMTYDELVNTILYCQKELNNRGTITQCKNIFFTGKQKSKFITFEPLQTTHNSD